MCLLGWRAHHRIFSSHGPKNSKFFYFPIGKSAPTESLARSPSLYLSGNRNSRLRESKVEHWALESPRPDGQSTLTFLFPLSELSYRDFATRDIKHSSYRLPMPDTPKLRCTRVELTFQLPVTSIGISDFAGSRILMSMFRDFTFPELRYCATCLPLTPVVPHCLRHRRDIADRDSKLQEYSVLETPDTLNPDFFGSSDTRPKQWTVLISSGYRVSRYRNSCCNNLELRLTKPRSTICVWIQRPSWS
jgi:hypothetical protein